MFDQEIDILKKYLEKCKKEIEYEENSFSEQVKRQSTEFFSKYEEEIDNSIKMEFESSLADIYKANIQKKKDALIKLNTQIQYIEKKCLDDLL